MSGAAPGAADDVAVGPLAADEIEAAVGVLARAFRDNPLNRTVLRRGPEARERANAAGMRSLVPTARRYGLVLASRERAPGPAGTIRGLLVATPPGGYPLPPPPAAARLRALLGQGLRASARWSEAFEALDAAHPPRPHWYLGTLGVDSEHQRHGHGTALLRAWLARVDADGEPAWLETDRAENRPFYARAGFQPAGEIRVLDVPVWLLRRPAAGGPQARPG